MERGYEAALRYAYESTRGSRTRAMLLELLERIRSGELLTIHDVRRGYPACYAHVLELRRRGVLLLVKERSKARGVLRFSG